MRLRLQLGAERLAIVYSPQGRQIFRCPGQCNRGQSGSLVARADFRGSGLYTRNNYQGLPSLSAISRQAGTISSLDQTGFRPDPARPFTRDTSYRLEERPCRSSCSLTSCSRRNVPQSQSNKKSERLLLSAFFQLLD